MELTLRNKTLTAAVDTAGGELVSLQDGAGTEYIWSGDPAYWSGRNPILFPIVGKLKDGVVEFQGKPYSMQQHGFARRSEFSVAQQGDDFVVFTLTENQNTLTMYPYSFLLSVRHQLTHKGFFTEFVVRNTGTAEMPFCIGAHTAFRCPLLPGEGFEDYELVFDQAETAGSILVTADGTLSHNERFPVLEQSDTMPLSYQPFDLRDTLVFDGLRSHGVSLRHKFSGHGVHMAFDGFPMVAFWTKPNARAPYLCLEPWHGCAALDNDSGKFEDKPYCIVLAPGEEKSLRYTVEILSA